jgi:hypothetical protein
MLIPSPKSGANCWVVDGNHSFWDALTWMDQLKEGRTVKIFNVDDLIKACAKNAIQNSKTVDFLAVFGHGTGGYQSVGAAKTYEESGTKSLRWKPISRPGESQLMGPAESKVRGLNGVLSPNATILLAGCNVGEGAYGTGLLTTVSTVLGNRAVQAFENAVYWWSGFLAGPLKEAKGSNVSSSFSVYTVELNMYVPVV